MTKIFLILYLVLFYGIAFLWRSYQTFRATGINPYRLNDGNNVHRFAGKWYRVISLGIVSTILLYVFLEQIYFYLTPIKWLEHPMVSGIGFVILFASFLVVVIAQVQMGISWRIGIDEDNPSELITGGIFQISRNPIFLGMRLSVFGLFLVLPNALTFTLWLIGDILLQIQVFLEEEYLIGTHNENYKTYYQKVKRWI
ncbi:MAG: isoprenylcysteine carboxylmethyltransferase family protein [Anaerolineae bacterium]|jgi:protein-S-isoprenylcysteine O-methyltransferase Ste14|nr:isoprenylcysteine carboxylmethyltransferase family protein [Anaerolineae bacterium]MBT7189017.1 isoprenylcysteine carboxylmethyltransferase family protein [Anaerolineae bacterium]MBT7990290.1 isoprenylcysteine carboxylmethyltransferase family protein [Anaerolineae bacterium]